VSHCVLLLWRGADPFPVPCLFANTSKIVSFSSSSCNIPAEAVAREPAGGWRRVPLATQAYGTLQLFPCNSQTLRIRAIDDEDDCVGIGVVAPPIRPNRGLAS